MNERKNESDYVLISKDPRSKTPGIRNKQQKNRAKMRKMKKGEGKRMKRSQAI
jgi:hypothetical protein